MLKSAKPNGTGAAVNNFPVGGLENRLIKQLAGFVLVDNKRNGLTINLASNLTGNSAINPTISPAQHPPNQIMSSTATEKLPDFRSAR